MEAPWIGERIWHTRFPISMEARNSTGSLGKHGMASLCTAWMRMWWLWCYHGTSSFLFGCIGYHREWAVHWSWWRGCQQVNLHILCIHEWWIYQLESLKAEEQLVSPQRQWLIPCGWAVGLKHLISLHLVIGTRTCGMTILMAETSQRDLEVFGGMEDMGRVPHDIIITWTSIDNVW